MTDEATSWFRGVEITLGIVSLAVAMIVLLNPGYSMATLISLLAFALMSNAIRLVASGGASYLPATVREIGVAVGAATVAIASLVVLEPALGFTTLVILISSGLIVQGAGRLAHVARHSGPAWLRVSALTVGSLTIFLAGVSLVDSSLAQLSLVALLTVTVAINGLDGVISGIRPSDPRQTMIIKLVLFALVYGFINVNWIDLFATSAPAYHIWLILTYMAPFVVLLVFQGLKDWQLALSLGLLVSLVNDLGYFFTGDLLFGYHQNLVSFLAGQLGFYGNQVLFNFQGGFFTFPVTSILMAASIYARIAVVSVILYNWWTRGSFTRVQGF